MLVICFFSPFSIDTVKQTSRHDVKMSMDTIKEKIQETFWCYLTYRSLLVF